MATPDLSEFVELGTRDQRQACKLAEMATKLDTKDLQSLEAAIVADPAVITNGAIEKWFKVRGYKVHLQSVANHRKGRCKCHG